jgi:hypothetical protein
MNEFCKQCKKPKPLTVKNMSNVIEKQITRITWLAVSSISLLLTGCNSTYTNPGTPQIPQTPPPVSGRAIPDTMAAEASAEAVRHFNVVVTATGGGVAEAVRQTIEGQLAAGGFKINDEAPDITVSLAVRSSEFDRTGNYIRYEGTAEVGINRTWDNKRLGFENPSVRAKRGLGEDEATRNLTAELSAAAADFVIRAARPEQSGLSALDVTIHRPWLTTRDPEYAKRFISAVKRQNGVIYCAMVAHDYDTKVLTFRIVYLADAMPEGLLNRLATLRDLQIKPRN